MLTHLQIRDFAIIDAVELELRDGLTVLTGETGAGKSILVDALQLLCGGRGGAEVIRHGAERADLSASFELSSAADLKRWLEEQAIPPADELLVRRVIGSDGRSRAYLNGQSVPLQQLREIGNRLIDIHGQHEFQSLVRPAAQRQLLDEYGQLEALADAVSIDYRVWLELLNRTLDLESKARDRDARLDLLRFQCQELAALQLKPGEMTALNEERSRLGHRGRLAEATHAALQTLYENESQSAHAGVSRSLTALRGLATVDTKLAPVVQALDEALIQIREAARELGTYAESLEVDSTRQDQVERRLAAIEELARKHRIEPEALPARLTQLTGELQSVETAEADLATLRRDLAAALESYQKRAAQLSARRQTAARALARDITKRMQGLGMAGGRFEIDVIQDRSTEPAEHGLDQIEFRVSANPGQPPRAVAKVASGGELARLSLAVQVACAARQSRTMVFDEVDAGIGGAIAEIVGRELRSLAGRAQVLCVTHLPQVASQGHHHLRVAKSSDGRTTQTRLAALEGDTRVEELARMLGGIEITSRAREHAREMLAAAASRDAASAAAATDTAENDSAAAGAASAPSEPGDPVTPDAETEVRDPTATVPDAGGSARAAAPARGDRPAPRARPAGSKGR